MEVNSSKSAHENESFSVHKQNHHSMEFLSLEYQLKIIIVDTFVSSMDVLGSWEVLHTKVVPNIIQS